MRFRFAAVALLLAISVAVALAQPFQIRVTQNTRLRASHSLEAARVETAPAGEVLQVVGRFNRWLEINRNGRLLWMADWVGHTRVEAPQVAPATDIDNCCFVDRQCRSEADWVDGYWAFQNGQCPARQPQSGASSSPPPANIDNCCFAGWHCGADGDWTAGYSAYQSNLCDRHPIHLSGSANFVFWMNAALDMLRASAPEWYVYVITGLNQIQQKPDHEMINIGAYVDLGSATMAIAGYHEAPFQNAPSLRERDIFTYLASVMVHEACHVHKWRAGVWFEEGWRNELPCHETELIALNRFVPAELSWIIEREQEIIDNYRQYGAWWGAGPYPFS